MAVLTLYACGGSGGSHPGLPTVNTTGDPASNTGASPRASSAPGATPTPQGTPVSGPTQSANVPKHIPTWAYDEYWGEGQSAPATQVQAYVTYAEGGQGNTKAVNDCGSSSSCSSVFYLNASLVYDCNSPFVAVASEDWYVHEYGYTDSLHRVQGTLAQTCGALSSYPVYAANSASAAVQSYFQSYLQKNADAWNYYFLDDTSGTVVDQFYGPSGGMCGGLCYQTEEQQNNAAVVSAHDSFVSSMFHTNGTAMFFFYNGLSFDGAQTPDDLTVLNSSSHFIGAACENCVVDNGVLEPSMYAPALNAMALINATPSSKFIELTNGSAASGSSAQITQRIVTIAVAWLGFSPAHTIVWANLEDNTDNLAVWPEEQLYPLRPLESMSAGASDITVAPGVWRREFAACYDSGTAIGQCAAVLNSTSSPIVVASTWLQQTYGHVITLAGGDIVSGGSVGVGSVTFAANATVVPAGGALLLSR
jgi:hypothetical protein